MHSAAVNYELIELLNIELLKGRAFSKSIASDRDKLIYNEEAIRVMGLTDPIGKIVDGKEILGVIKNFHFQSLHEPVKPFCFCMESNAATTIMVKISSRAIEGVIDELKKIHAAYNPGLVFNYRFLDQEYESRYVAERKVALLSQYFASLAIILSCLGLFGLAAFTVEQRSKEIAIRKVLGLSSAGIVLLLSNQFLRMVILSIVVALPASYFISTEWLNGFAYRINLQWWFFGGAIGVTLLTAWLTISIHTFRAAVANPSQRLRSE